MSSSYEQAREVLRDLRDRSKVLVDTCDKNPALRKHSIRTDLINFRDATLDILSHICDQRYFSRPDVQRYNADLYIICTSATSDVRALAPLIEFSTSKSPKPTELRKLTEFGSRLESQSKELHRLLDHMNGREDWSGLAALPPSTPQRIGRSEKRVNFTPSTLSTRRSTSSRSPRPPTVEDVVDSGIDEPPSPRINTYYMPPQEIEKERAVSPPANRDLPAASPIQFVLRQPTDPNELEPLVSPLDMDHIHEPFKTLTIVDPPEEEHRRSSLPELQAALDRKRDELQRLRDQLASTEDAKDKRPMLSDPFSFNTNSQSSNSSNYYSARSTRRSVDYGSLHPDTAPRRPRSSTMSNADVRRPILKGHSLSDDALRPNRSPRYSSPQYSAKDYSSPPRRFADMAPPSPRNRHTDLYGIPHNTSLPTVLEQSIHRDTLDKAKKRASWTPNSTFGTGGDFDLFDSGESSSAMPLFKVAEPAPVLTTVTGSDTGPGNIKCELTVTSRELFAGCNKPVKIHRFLEEELSEIVQSFPEVVRVPILPGLTYGQRVTIPGHGDWDPKRRACGDLIVTLIKDPNDEYELDGRIIYTRIEVSVLESLIGWTRNIDTICGEPLEVSRDRATPQGTLINIGHYGLPKFLGKNVPPGPRAAMVLRVEVKWPTGKLDSAQKHLLKQALGEGYRSPRRRH